MELLDRFSQADLSSLKAEVPRAFGLSDCNISRAQGIMRVVPGRSSGGKLNISLYRYLAVT